MSESKDLVTTNGFMYKIKMFFRNLFGRKDDKVSEVKEFASDENNSFKKEISIEKSPEEKRFIIIDEEYRSGKIKVSDISKDDMKKMIKFYNDEIDELKKKISYNEMITEKYKREILEMKKEA